MNRLLGRTAAARLGSLLLACGIALLAWAVLWQVGLAPGSRVTLPEPVALGRSAEHQSLAQAAPTSAAVPAVVEAVPARAEEVAEAPATPAPLAARPLRAPVLADRGDRIEAAAPPRPGYATRLRIPAIRVDTEVRQAGIKLGPGGELEWETLPFVAAHYGDRTALVGARGNAVIAGHVATLSEGNVFFNLYQLHLGDEITVQDQLDQQHRFRVADVKLVAPDDVSVMQQTPEPTLTLITCGGTFDPQKREFSHRLIVIATPA